MVSAGDRAWKQVTVSRIVIFGPDSTAEGEKSWERRPWDHLEAQRWVFSMGIAFDGYVGRSRPENTLQLVGFESAADGTLLSCELCSRNPARAALKHT